MNMDSAAVFLAGTILYMLGGIIILIGVVVANNIIHKFWKSFGWAWMPQWTQETHRFMSQEEAEKIAPHLENENGKKEASKKV